MKILTAKFNHGGCQPRSAGRIRYRTKMPDRLAEEKLSVDFTFVGLFRRQAAGRNIPTVRISVGCVRCSYDIVIDLQARPPGLVTHWVAQLGSWLCERGSAFYSLDGSRAEE